MARDVMSIPTDSRCQLKIARSAAHALSESLPEKVARAAFEFTSGPLLENPHQVGKALRAPLAPAYSARRGSYRVLYLIDDDTRMVLVTAVAYRVDAYRS